MTNRYKIFNGAKYISSGIFQSYLVFIPATKCTKYFNGTTRVYSWKSNGMPEENVENITKSDSLFAPTFVPHYILPDINNNAHCLINNNISFLKNGNKFRYFLHTKSIVKKFKHKFYIK